MSEAKCTTDPSREPTPEAPTTEPDAPDPCAVDPWLAAACALGLVHGIWSAELHARKGPETAPRRARFPHAPRPST
jgi:hypothetical protein